jgi:hypothetical protein
MQVTVQSASSEEVAKRSSENKEPLRKLLGNERRRRLEIWPTGMSPRTGTGGLGPVYINNNNYYYYYCHHHHYHHVTSNIRHTRI